MCICVQNIIIMRCEVKLFEYGEKLIYDNHVRDIHRDLISLLLEF